MSHIPRIRRSCAAPRPGPFSIIVVALLSAVLGLGGHTGAQPAQRLGPPPRGPERAEAGLAGAAGLSAGRSVDPTDRAASVQFYLDHYLIAAPPAHGWAGSVAGCAPGATSAAFKAAVAGRINYFRAMAGVPATVELIDSLSEKAQAAALMMSANGDLDHTPPASWSCYSDTGYQGAGSSNLALGAYGWGAIDLYMRDPGDGNTFVGHRRWVLHPPIEQMGTGDVPGAAGQPAANALAVFGGASNAGAGVREAEGFVAWPPRGYVPYTLIYPRWSFSYPGASFAGATVRMRAGGGAALPLTVQPVVNGYGLNTLVWEPDLSAGGFGGTRPPSDLPFEVTIDNVVVGGQSRSFSYRVTVIDLTMPPRDLRLTAAALYEGAPSGAVAGTLSATDPEGGALTYSLVAGAGDDDNGRFRIEGATLRTLTTLDYEQQASYSVRVQVASGRSGGAAAAAFTISLRDVDEIQGGPAQVFLPMLAVR